MNWEKHRHTWRGRLWVEAATAALMGLTAAPELMTSVWTVVFATIGGGVIGILAVMCLEWRDRRRAARPDRQQRLNERAELLRSTFPHVTAERALRMVTDQEDNRPSFLTKAGMVLGGFVALCGIVMGIVHAVEFFRDL